MWLPRLSACNLQSLTPLLFASFFLSMLIYIARYVLGSLNVSSQGTKFGNIPVNMLDTFCITSLGPAV